MISNMRNINKQNFIIITIISIITSLENKTKTWLS